jgi:hypothetical protein
MCKGPKASWTACLHEKLQLLQNTVGRQIQKGRTGMRLLGKTEVKKGLARKQAIQPNRSWGLAKAECSQSIGSKANFAKKAKCQPYVRSTASESLGLGIADCFHKTP